MAWCTLPIEYEYVYIEVLGTHAYIYMAYLVFWISFGAVMWVVSTDYEHELTSIQFLYEDGMKMPYRTI